MGGILFPWSETRGNCSANQWCERGRARTHEAAPATAVNGISGSVCAPDHGRLRGQRRRSKDVGGGAEYDDDKGVGAVLDLDDSW